MKIPFTIEQFFQVFREYNLYVWPFQIALNLFAVLCIVLVFKRSVNAGKIILIALSFLWVWMGIVYHLIFFKHVNKTAYLFGALFIIQGVLFFLMAARKKIMFQFQRGAFGITAMSIIFFSLILYPAIGYLQHHIFPSAPTFGLPCPTTIFTFGLLLLAVKQLPAYIMIIPLIWSLIGSTAAFKLGIYEDLGLLISACLATGMFIAHHRSIKNTDLL